MESLTDKIPEAVRLSTPVHQRETLIGGAYVSFAGTQVPVHSAVCMESDEGLKQLELGSHPAGGVGCRRRGI